MKSKSADRTAKHYQTALLGDENMDLNKGNLPPGWSIKPFLKCIEKEASSNKLKIPQKDFKESGKFAIVDQSVSFVAGYTDNSQKVYDGELPVVIFGDHTRIFKYVDFPFALGADGTKILVPRKDILVPKYFYFFLKGLRIESHGYSRHFKFLKEKEITIPPLETQKEIVAMLEKAEMLKAWRKEADRLTDEYLKSVFLEMFGDPIKNNKAWTRIKLGKLCDIRRGASPRPIKDYLGGTVPWVKIGDGSKGNDIYIEETKEKIIEDGVSKSVLVKKGALVFANCGVSLGFARILKIDGCIHDGWLSFENIDSGLNKMYLLKFINFITDHFRKIAPEGTQPNLNTGIMKNFEIPLPPIDLQNKFADIVEHTETLREYQKHSKTQIDNLFNTLMQKAFRGELAC